MEESISSSRTTALYGNSYYCHYHHQQQQPPASPAAATVASDSENADSGWTAYFLQLASDEEDASPSREKKLRDVGGGRASASTVSKPNRNKGKKVLKGVKKTKDVLVVGTRILEEEEDPLQDTASSPLLQPMQTEEFWSTPAGCEHYEQRPATSATEKKCWRHEWQDSDVGLPSVR